MFETYYPVRTELPEAADRYRDTPLGVEAAWPPTAEAADERQPAMFEMKSP